MRYVPSYRCEAIQCRRDNIHSYVFTYLELLRQPWIASPHTDLRNSTMGAIRRPRRTGFAQTRPARGRGYAGGRCLASPSKPTSLIFDI
ncbi:MAG: hypothetical protein LBM98_07600 [Oscillospiraceae bacterium]|nr:hypothetical protein [Oscillospiraceae bacterium]